MQIFPVGQSEHELAFACAMILVNSFGLSFNFLIICMFVGFKQQILTNNKNLFFLSMSIADLFVGFAGVAGGIIFLFMTKASTTLTVYKIGGVLPFFGSFFMSILSLGLITTDRFIAIMLPLRHRLMMTRKRIKLAIGLCWLIVIILMTIQGLLFIFASARTEIQVRCLLLGIFFFVGSIVLSVSNTILYRTVRNRTAMHNLKVVGFHIFQHALQHSGSKKRQRFRSMKRKDETTRVRVCIWMTVLFIVCWLPVTIYYLIWLALTTNPAGRLGLTVCFALVGFNSVLNPVIYLLQRKDFRFYFRKMVCKKVIKGRSYADS